MRVAVCQMTSGADIAANLDQAVSLLSAAAAAGAELAALPENFERVAPAAEKLAGATPIDGPVLAPIRQVARRHGMWILAGSFAESTAGGDRIHNTSVLLDPSGASAAVYRKIHLFDADVGDGTPYRESDLVIPGSVVAVAETPAGLLGLSICYDLRFPELYRQLVKLGAEILAVPAAFTEATGRDHWELLLRARAVEDQCFVIAPAQTGLHPGNRRTWGHALIADPWGRVLADAGTEPGIATAEIDLAVLRELRRSMPVLGHRKL